MLIQISEVPTWKKLIGFEILSSNLAIIDCLLIPSQQKKMQVKPRLEATTWPTAIITSIWLSISHGELASCFYSILWKTACSQCRRTTVFVSLLRELASCFYSISYKTSGNIVKWLSCTSNANCICAILQKDRGHDLASTSVFCWKTNFPYNGLVCSPLDPRRIQKALEDEQLPALANARP